MAPYRYLSLGLAWPSLTLVFGSTPHCRCLYGQACWPKDDTFSTLSQKLSQPLIRPAPVASACYSSSSFPQGNCSDVIAHFSDGNWRADQPGALENVNFEAFIQTNGTIDACYLNVTLGIPCKQGSIPPIGVDARTVEDVQEAVVFARQNDLRLVVKNTGHDYMGRSAGRGGFLVWTHHLKNMTYDEAFVPAGAPSKSSETFNAITLGSGVQWHEAYDFAQQHGRVLVGGLSAGGSVGAAGGWVTGGGHSALSPLYGLGVDHVLQFTVVLANGNFVTVNAHQYPDLFWALRGGGGGTYGVVISATYRSHPSFPVSMAVIVANFSSPSIAHSVATEFIRFHPNFTDAGWGSYSSISNTKFESLWLAPNSSVEDTNSKFSHFASFVAKATNGTAQTFTLPFNSYYEWYYSLFILKAPTQVGFQVEITSRLLPRAIAESDPARAAKIMLSIENGVALNSIGGGAVSRADPSSTGLNPSWRKALAEVYTTASWSEGTTAADIFKAREKQKKETDILDELTTDSGAYLNEASLYERDFKKSFFGSHYSQLKSIKQKYDASSLFIVASGVGSEDWDKNLLCRL